MAKNGEGRVQAWKKLKRISENRNGCQLVWSMDGAHLRRRRSITPQIRLTMPEFPVFKLIVNLYHPWNSI